MNELHKQNQYEMAEGEGDTLDGEPLLTKQTWIYQKIQRINTIASKASNSKNVGAKPGRKEGWSLGNWHLAVFPKLFCVDASHSTCINAHQQWKWKGLGRVRKNRRGERERQEEGENMIRKWVEGVFWIASTCFEVNKKSRGPKEKKWGS